jgi:hypothetical protein
MSDLEQWNPCLVLKKPEEIFEIHWNSPSLSFVFCFAEDVAILGHYLMVDRLFNSAPDLKNSGRSRFARPRKSPQCFPLECYSVVIRPRPAWARRK